jgi:hypothetical protein
LGSESSSSRFGNGTVGTVSLFWHEKEENWFKRKIIFRYILVIIQQIFETQKKTYISVVATQAHGAAVII